MRAQLRAHQLRATPARITVLRLLRAAVAPLSHDDVVQRLGARAHDRATVYRSLNRLAEVGLVRKVDLGDRVWRFAASSEADDRGLGADFTCTTCLEVRPLPQLEFAVIDGGAPASIARRQVAVRVYGVCDACAVAANTERAR